MKMFLMGTLVMFFFVKSGYSQIKLEGMKVGTGIEASELVGESATFPADGNKVYCWIKVVGGEGQTVTMKWSFNGTVTDEIPLEIKSWSMRTYAFKEIHRAGAWKIEVAGADGSILKSTEFTAQ